MAEVPAVETTNNGPISRARASLAALETLQRLRQAPHTAPSLDDLTALRGWSGWGPLAPALEPDRSGSWEQIGERISSLLPQEHYDHGVQATYNAFYTPPGIAAACWRILTDLGFAGGRILEPGCGAGAFLAATPDGVSTTWTGIERDPTTAAIANLLHPGATIHTRRLEETPLASYSMDAVLGNVPFGNTQVYDPTTPRELTANLHNYFIYRSVQALRPGGVAVLTTSRYTMDGIGESAFAARVLIAREAELLGAIRLPNDALTSGGAEPLVDVLILRRRRADDPNIPEQNQWIATGPAIGSQQTNEYFLANPTMVLGELAEDNAPQYGRTLRVDARPNDPPLDIALKSAGHAITTLAADRGLTWRVDAGATPITADSVPFELRPDGRKEGSFHLIDGVPHEVVDAQLVPVHRPGKELPKLIALRDAVLRLLDAEKDHTTPDAQLEPQRAEASRLYDAYVAAHGCLNRYTVTESAPDENGVAQVSRRRPPMGGFRRDPDYVTVLALEDFDDDTRTATKASLLTRRVNRPRERAAHARNPADAMALCRDELGVLDLGRVAELLHATPPEAERLIGDLAFVDPAADSWVPSDEYLTGDVRAKLTAAKAAAVRDLERFGRNIPALEAVIPPDLEPEQIKANLGAAWIPAADIEDFARELLGFPLRVWHEPHSNTWSVHTSPRAEQSAAATSEWGTSRVNAYQLLDYGLNGKAPAVSDRIDGKNVHNQGETLAACDRLEAVATRFSTWMWEDPDRAERLAAAYNQSFNATVPRQFDGSHLTFPGIDPGFTPYPHQRDIVARMIAGSDALCPYPVGTGKTASMFMAAAKLKALGLAAKPLIIVVPSTLEQIARDGKRLFPNARILIAGKEDLGSARARKLFAARCAMEEWDAVVMSHPSFTSLSVHPTVEANYIASLAAEYRAALVSANTAGAAPRKIKQIAKMVDNLDAGAKDLLSHASDDGVFFEHLGVDYLLVDEMHYFKNLGVPVHTDGFTVNGSKRAQDLDMKLGWLRGEHPGHAVVTGFTGTPVTNTLLEAFILQHYLQPERLKELGLQSADAWAATFVRFATAVEITPDGGFRLNRRPAEIVNIPELMHILGEVAELRPPESFPVQRPDLRRHNFAVEASETVLEFVHSLAERAEDIHAGGVDPSDDNILKVCSDGRKVALHESLVGLEPEGPGKIDALAENVARIYHDTKDLHLPGDGPDTRGTLQLIFCDLGTPDKDKGAQVYGLTRDRLIRAGIPAERIRFIHDATTNVRRLALFDQCNNGDVSVLLGSTDKLGVGVNVQRRAIAAHHLDAPWRPDQVEQRDGRVWRPKNLNPAVDIYRYVTEGSFDAFMWQALERKEKALRPILSGQATARSIEDIGDVALDYGQIKALSTGNPLLTELNEVAFEIKRLASLAANHQRNQRRLRADSQALTTQTAAAATAAEALEAVARCAVSHPGDSPWVDADLKPIPEKDVPATLGALAESTIAKGYCDGAMHWRSLDIDFTYSKNQDEAVLTARLITDDDQHRIDVPLNPSWAAKGQSWRIRDAIATAVADAYQTAAETRDNIQILRQRIDENEAAIAQPFADQGALEEARTRRAVLDAAIHEQAQRDERTRRYQAPLAAAGTPPIPESEQGMHGREEGVLEERFDHAFPGWRELVPVVASMDYKESQNKKAYTQWKDSIAELYPAGWVEAGGPVLVARNPGGTRWHDDWFLGGNYNVCGVERAQDLHDPGRHRGRTRLVAASFQPRDIPIPRPSDKAAGELTAQDTAAALAGIFTPAKLLGISAGLQDKSALRAWLKARAVESRDEHVGHRPTTPGQPSAFDTVTETREGLAVMVLTETERREGLISWAQTAEYLRPALTPEAGTRLSERYQDFQRFYTDPQREITPTLTALRLLREQAAVIHQAAAAANQLEAVAKPGEAVVKEPLPQTSSITVRRSAPPPKPRQRSEMFEQAVDLAIQGFAVFPLVPGTKRPMFKGWEETASTDPHQIARWWNATPTANIAIACGPSNLLVIDLDKAKKPGGPRHGQETLTRLAAGRELPRTFTVTSARGGRHLYYRQPEGAALTVTTGSDTAGLGPLIDTRGHGGYIVAPGSIVGGGTYRIEHDATVAPLPTWILDELTKRPAAIEPSPSPTPPRTPVTERRRSAYGKAAVKQSTETVAAAPEGIRNDTLNRESFRLGRLVGGGVLNRDDAVAELHRAARRAGLPLAEAAKTITSGMTAGTSHPRSIPSPAIDSQPQETFMATTKPEQITGPTTVPAAEFDFDEIWTGVRASIERARQAIPDWTELNSPDDLKSAIDEALSYLAQAPVSRTIDDNADNNTPELATNSPETTSTIAQPTETMELGSENLDGYLAAVDNAYAEAQAAGIPTDRAEWVRINAIHSAVHNLWDTLKATAGTYWADLSADIRVRGLLTTLATRAVRAIATLADSAATHLEQRSTQQQLGTEIDGPILREAYIKARNHVHAHAATHEWQRIAALWGTVNTLTRQTDDPGIRAVVARSADAISDYADTLSRKTSQYGHAGAADALAALAVSAEQHAAGLRTDANAQTPGSSPHQVKSATNSVQPLGDNPPSRESTDAQLLQARARQVAQHAQARLGQPSRSTPAPSRRDQNTPNARNQNNLTRPAQPSSPRPQPRQVGI